MKSFIKEAPWLYIISIAMYVPLRQTEASNKFYENKVIFMTFAKK